MLRSLLVGMNGSEDSHAACEVAFAWANELKIPVTCIGVVDPTPLVQLDMVRMESGERAVAYDPQLIVLEREKVAAGLKRATNRAFDLGVSARILLMEGSPAAILGEEAQRHDLLFLGRRSSSEGVNPGPSDMLVDILRHSPRPIILGCRQIPRYSSVLIAYDGSAQAARTLQSFVSSGLYYGHPLHLVGVSNLPEQMQEILGRANDYLNAHSLNAEKHVLPVGASVASTLIDFARQIPTGLLVIGAYGQPWYKESLFGSVTKSMLASIPVPMFVNH
eukprot:TRINITY_DN6080_c1_g1_i5.p1 TRINITY_DN6080_c1_g1~~TRINITY_DN6080_c1_g1_i5.p1  ORF type:complete len:277 (+),score=18.21 TRINITY_DN6080_c1_g1_i5:66-896(+)